jgi:hypothetical protein
MFSSSPLQLLRPRREPVLLLSNNTWRGTRKLTRIMSFFQGCGSGLDPDSIGQWIQEGKNDPQK